MTRTLSTLRRATTVSNAGRLICRTALLAACCAPLALAACTKQDPVAQALTEAQIELAALSPGGNAAVADSYKKQTYQKVVSILQPVSDQGGPGQTAAAWMLIAQAQMGLAELPAAEASQIQRTTLNQIAEARSLLTQWVSLNAVASAADTYDPSSELAEIDATIARKEAEIVQVRQAKAAIDNEVLDLKAQAAAQQKAAKGASDIEARVRTQAVKLSHTQATDLIKEANVHKRASDGYAVKAAILLAEAAKIEPESAQLALNIEKLENQREKLGQARTESQDRAAMAKERASLARASAAAVAQQISQYVSTLQTVRNDELKPKSEAALSAYKQAAASSRKIVAGARTSGQLSVAAAQQSLGDALWTSAEGARAFSELLGALVGSQPALPEARAYAATMSQTNDLLNDLLEQAGAAYEAAHSANSSARARGETQERIERINKLLASAVTSTTGKSIDDPNADQDDQGTSPDAEDPQEDPILDDAG